MEVEYIANIERLKPNSVDLLLLSCDKVYDCERIIKKGGGLLFTETINFNKKQIELYSKVGDIVVTNDKRFIEGKWKR